MSSTAISQPPAGSCFVIDFDDEQRPRLTWSSSHRALARWLPAGFLLFWLCGWAAGEFFACWALIAMVFGNGFGGGFEWFAVGFLLFWLTFWTIGGVTAILALAALIRGPRPERIILAPELLSYDAGTAFFHNPDENSKRSFRSYWNARPQEFARAGLGTIRLERVGERQRLSIDVGAERIEIGPTLKEPEREWLAQVLRAWAGQSDATPPRE